MWTWEQSRQLPQREAAAESGAVTLSGDPAGVLLGGERRWLPVYAPGGYGWRPAEGDRVLVLKAGSEGEAPCILAAPQPTAELEPGEVQISGGSSTIRLGREGLELNGEIRVNGRTLEAVIRAVAEELVKGSEA